jgi:hypothetical protein
LFVIQDAQKVSVNLMIIVQKHAKIFLKVSITMITYLELGRRDGVSVSLVSKKIWRMAEDTLNITSNCLCYNYQMHTDFLITLYNVHNIIIPLCYNCLQYSVQ